MKSQGGYIRSARYNRLLLSIAVATNLAVSPGVQAAGLPSVESKSDSATLPVLQVEERQTAQEKIEEKQNLGDPDAIDAKADLYAKEAAERPKVITTKQHKKNAAEQATKVYPADANQEKELKKILAVPQFIEKPASTKAQPDATIVVKRPTVALALGGGGARGAAHIGVLKVFLAEEIPIDYIVGNSMGAIVGGLYCAGVPLEKIQAILEDSSLRKAYLPKSPPSVLIGPWIKLTHPLARRPYAGLWSGQKFAKFLDELMPVKDQTFADLKIPFSAVACNLVDGKAYRLSEGKVTTAIRASSALSPILQPVAIGDKIYIDGGIRANLPAASARDTGANVVIAVLVDDPLKPLKAAQFRTLKGITSRVSDVILSVTDEHQLQFADIVINPDVSDIHIISKNGADVRRAVLAGEVAARASLPEIRKRLGLPMPSLTGDLSKPQASATKY